MKSTLLVPIILAASIVAVDEASAGSSRRAHLTGAEMAPPVETHATGHVVFQVGKDGTELLYKLVVANVENVTGAKLHLGSKDANGAAIASLYPIPGKPRVDGKFNGTLAEGAVSAASLTGSLAGQSISELLAQIDAGSVYVCVTTRAHPNGEIRGQVR